MKPKRGETAEQTISRWALELVSSTSGKSVFEASQADFDRAIEMVGWLKSRIDVLRVQNTADWVC